MESIYGGALPDLESVKQAVLEEIEKIRNEMIDELGMDPVEHVLARVKSEESMREKCRRRGAPETPKTALVDIQDAIGLRIVCAFLDDVYTIKDRLLCHPGIEAVMEKDYIRDVKPNGYRSFHLIIQYDLSGRNSCDITGGKYFAEIQLRTISMDTWAALEHHLNYKKKIKGNVDLIRKELKRCADELASTDDSMQTLRDMIQKG